MTKDRDALLELAEYWERRCNRYVNGACSIRSCLVRGGWSAGKTSGYDATCEEHETANALRAHAAMMEDK